MKMKIKKLPLKRQRSNALANIWDIKATHQDAMKILSMAKNTNDEYFKDVNDLNNNDNLIIEDVKVNCENEIIKT